MEIMRLLDVIILFLPRSNNVKKVLFSESVVSWCDLRESACIGHSVYMQKHYWTVPAVLRYDLTVLYTSLLLHWATRVTISIPEAIDSRLQDLLRILRTECDLLALARKREIPLHFLRSGGICNLQTWSPDMPLWLSRPSLENAGNHCISCIVLMECIEGSEVFGQNVKGIDAQCFFHNKSVGSFAQGGET